MLLSSNGMDVLLFILLLCKCTVNSVIGLLKPALVCCSEPLNALYTLAQYARRLLTKISTHYRHITMPEFCLF